MKKNILLIITGVILFGLIIFSSVNYIIIPNVKHLNQIDDDKLTTEDIIALREEINNKYQSLEQSIDNKYQSLEEDVNNKYSERKSEIQKQLNEKKALKNEEFFNGGFTEYYYTLQSEIDELEDEIRNIESNINKEIRNIESNIYEEKEELNSQKQKELLDIELQNTNNASNKVKFILLIILGVIIILSPLLYLWSIFNKLTKLCNNVKNKWSEVDIYLKQRTDLIPNIVETVKGYSKHEKDTLTDVINARTQVVNASSKEEEIASNENLSKMMKQLFALAESCPELKANTNFMTLQSDLREIENQIANARSEYNRAVLRYKNKMEVFPSNIVASIFDFKEELFFEINEEEKENKTIKFN